MPSDLSAFFAERTCQELFKGWRTIRGKPIVYRSSTPTVVPVWHGFLLDFEDKGAYTRVNLEEPTNSRKIIHFGEYLARMNVHAFSVKPRDISVIRGISLEYAPEKEPPEYYMEVHFVPKDNAQRRLSSPERLFDAIYRSAILPFMGTIVSF